MLMPGNKISVNSSLSAIPKKRAGQNLEGFGCRRQYRQPRGNWILCLLGNADCVLLCEMVQPVTLVGLLCFSNNRTGPVGAQQKDTATENSIAHGLKSVQGK